MTLLTKVNFLATSYIEGLRRYYLHSIIESCARTLLAMIAAVFIVIFVLILLLSISQKKSNAICKSDKRLDGKTALVTGGTAGMGLEIATELARRGARVIVACPFPGEGSAAREHIVRTTRNDDVHFKLLDLASLASTRRFAADILAHEARLDLLVNNAGVGGPLNRKSDDGINFVMQVNYFGKFLLTLLLLPLLKKSGRPGDPSRIVNTASLLHILGRVDIDNFVSKKVRFFNFEYYCDSKFCVVLFSGELAKRLREENVVVNTVDPGAVGTRIFDGWIGWFGKVITWLFFCLFKTPWQGAQTALHVSLDEATGDVSGEYFRNCRMSKAVSRAYDDKLAKNVWEESLKIVKLDL